VTRPLR
jgi:hypothetical protein